MSTVPELGPDPVVVRAWAPWCSNCRAMHPIVADVAAAGPVRVVDLHVDESPELTERLGIRSVPTLVAFRDGEEIGRLVGARPRDAVESLFAMASGDGDEVRPTAPRGLLAARAGAGAAIAVGGVALDSLVLIAVGAAIGLWALLGAARVASTERTRSTT